MGLLTTPCLSLIHIFSGRLELEVTELLRTDTSMVIGENEYILTAADAGGVESVFSVLALHTGDVPVTIN